MSGSLAPCAPSCASRLVAKTMIIDEIIVLPAGASLEASVVDFGSVLVLPKHVLLALLLDCFVLIVSADCHGPCRLRCDKSAEWPLESPNRRCKT